MWKRSFPNLTSIFFQILSPFFYIFRCAWIVFWWNICFLFYLIWEWIDFIDILAAKLIYTSIHSLLEINLQIFKFQCHAYLVECQISCDKRCDLSSIIFLQNDEKKFFKRKDLLQVEEPPVVQAKKPKLSDSPPAPEPVKNNVDLIEERLASKERLLPREEVCVAINCTLCSAVNLALLRCATCSTSLNLGVNNSFAIYTRISNP